MNLSTNTLLAALCLIVLVVVINIGLFYALRSKNTHEQINLIRKAGESARHPWKREEDSLNELSQKINRLKPGNSNFDAGSDEIESPRTE